MKQLKFMLAAATAIGLATAAQAGTNYSGFPDNFDSATAGVAATTLTGYDFKGTDGDDESVVQAGGYNQSANALKVNTGTEPLLRAIDYSTAANAVELDKSKAVEKINSLTIDTMVQFTVTPKGDTVTSTTGDKLLIYLKETDAGNVLMVKAAKFAMGDELAGTIDSFEEMDVPVSAEELAVEANTWYNLKVTTKLDAGFPVFEIFVDNKQLISSVVLYDAEGKLFPSLQGKKSTALTYVGFAGEGLVDDLVVSRELDAPSTVDFTFTWTTDGISAVKYAIGDATEYTPLADDKKITGLAPDAIIKIQITPDDWYAVKDDADLEYTASEGSAGLDDLIKEVTAADLDVKNPSGASDDTVNAALAWAKNANKTPEAVEAASNIVANYLLDVTDLTVEPKIKITSIDLSGGTPVVTAEVTNADGTKTIKQLTSENINADATIKYKAAATLEALKSAASKAAIEAGDQFIKVVVE